MKTDLDRLLISIDADLNPLLEKLSTSKNAAQDLLTILQAIEASTGPSSGIGSQLASLTKGPKGLARGVGTLAKGTLQSAAILTVGEVLLSLATEAKKTEDGLEAFRRQLKKAELTGQLAANQVDLGEALELNRAAQAEQERELAKRRRGQGGDRSKRQKAQGQLNDLRTRDPDILLAQARGRLEEIASEFERLSQPSTSRNNRREGVRAARRDQRQALEAKKTETEAFIAILEGRISAEKALERSKTDTNSRTEESVKAVEAEVAVNEELDTVVSGVNEKLAELCEKHSELKQKMEGLAAAVPTVGAAAGEAAGTATELEQAYLDATQKIEGAFGAMFKNGKFNFDQLKGVALNALDGILNKIFEIVDQDLLGGFFGKLLGGGSGGLFGDLLGGVGGLFGLAGGGAVQPGGPVLVGERGPEIFVPKTVGSIIPNGDIGRGGQPVIVNMTNRFDVGLESVDSRIVQAAAPIAAQAVAAIEEARERDFR